MNLFLLAETPSANAKAHPDKLVVKMPVEVCQMLASAQNRPLTKADGTKYKPTHTNHPCTVWCNESDVNYAFAVAYGLALCDEYEARYKRRHACRQPLLQAQSYVANVHAEPARFAVAISPAIRAVAGIQDALRMPLAEAIQAYRAYLLNAKLHYAEWRHCPPPTWWPRAESAGRLSCRIKKQKHIKPKLVQQEQEQTCELWQILEACGKMTPKQKQQICEQYHAKQPIACDLPVARAKQARASASAYPSTATNEIADIIARIRVILSGRKVPRPATVAKFLLNETADEIVHNYTTFWLSKL